MQAQPKADVLDIHLIKVAMCNGIHLTCKRNAGIFLQCNQAGFMPIAQKALRTQGPYSSVPSKLLQAFFLHVCDEIGQAAGISPFIIVPTDDFGKRAFLNEAIFRFYNG